MQNWLSLFYVCQYEAAERKRRAALEGSRNGESNEATVTGTGQSLRREVWVRPSGHRTTTLRRDSRDEHLASMTPVEVLYQCTQWVKTNKLYLLSNIFNIDK